MTETILMDGIKESINVSSFIPSVFALNRQRLYGYFKDGDVLFFEGQEERMRNADTELLFRQDSDFLYVSGVELPGSKFIMEVATKETTLVIPDQDEMYPVWHGIPKTLEQWSQEYQITRTIYNKDLKAFLEDLKAKGRMEQFYILDLVDSPFKEWSSQKNSKKFKKALHSSRAVKTPLEIEIIKETCRISSLGHIEIMKRCQVNLKESHLESLFFTLYFLERLSTTGLCTNCWYWNECCYFAL
jgi:Xaa-Pro aminopeptidase